MCGDIDSKEEGTRREGSKRKPGSKLARKPAGSGGGALDQREARQCRVGLGEGEVERSRGWGSAW